MLYKVFWLVYREKQKLIILGICNDSEAGTEKCATPSQLWIVHVQHCGHVCSTRTWAVVERRLWSGKNLCIICFYFHVNYGALVLFRGMFTPSPFLYNTGLEAVLFVMYVKNEKGCVIPFYDMKIFYKNILQQIVSAIIFTLMG